MRFSAAVVRCRLRRPGETPAYCGVSGRFGLRNRPEVANGGSRAVKVAHLDACFGSVGAGRHPRMDKRLKPAGVQAISSKLVWWRGECGRVYRMAVSDRARAKSGCCPVLFGEEGARGADKARLALGLRRRRNGWGGVGASRPIDVLLRILDWTAMRGSYGGLHRLRRLRAG